MNKYTHFRFDIVIKVVFFCGRYNESFSLFYKASNSDSKKA